MNCPDCKSPKIASIEFREVYDGVAYWKCEACGHQWHRFDKDDYRRKRLEKLSAETGPIAEKP